MSDVSIQAFLFLTFFVLLFLLYIFLQWKAANEARRNHRYIILAPNYQTTPTHQQEDIYNISGSVQQQQQQQQPQQVQGQRSVQNNSQLPLNNLTISNETNKHNDDPPSYEEAMRLATVAPHDATNSAVSVVVAPVIPTSPTAPKLTD